MSYFNKGIKVLFVEDDVSIRNLLKNLLGSSILKIDSITSASSVAEAVSHFSEKEFDVIILDLMLSGSKGVNTFKALRKCSENIPVIILSGTADISFAMEAISLGAQDYLMKDDLNERLLTKSILYSIEKNKNGGNINNADEQYLMIRKPELEAIKSQELASQIINAALDAIVCIDKYGKVIVWNPQAVNLFGWNQDEALGKVLADLIIPEEYREVHEQGVKNFLETSKAPFLNNLNEVIAVDKSGKKFPVEFFLVHIEEEINFFCVFIRDISLRKKTEQRDDEQVKHKLVLADLSKAFSGVENLEDICKITIDAIQHIFSVEKLSVIAIEDSNSKLVATARNLSDSCLKDISIFNPWENEVENFSSIFIENVYESPIVATILPAIQKEGVLSVGFIPLVHQQKLIGRIIFLSSVVHQYTEAETELLGKLTSNVSLAIAQLHISNALKKSEEKYRTLIEQASDAIIIYSLDGKIVDYNNAFMSTTGYEKADIGDLRLTDLLFKEDMHSRPLLFDKIVSGIPVHDVRNVRRKNGASMHAELNSKLMPDGNVMVIARDITERRRVEAAIKESEAKYRTLVEQAVDAIALYDANGIILDVNTGSANLLGYEKEELIGMSLKDILLPIEFEINPIRYDILQKGISTIRQRKMLNKDGNVIQTEVRSQQLPNGLFLSVTRDMSERIKSEKQIAESYEAIRQLTSHLQNVREEERTSIAKEIHDELGQKLTVLKMDASWLKTKIVDEDVAIKNRVNDFITMLDETVETVRRITLELRPSLLDDLGLIPAMEWHLDEFEKRFDITTKLVSQIDEIELSEAAKTSLFRIFQESLTNVARHSQAKEVTVAIMQKGKNLFLSIDDNGAGFDKDKLNERKTLGILGMQERMTMLGGKYDITSKMGKGTEVLVQLQVN